MTDLTFLDDGNPDLIKGEINMEKCNRYLQLIDMFQSYQTGTYEFQEVPSIRQHLLDDINLETDYDHDSLYELSLAKEPRDSASSSSQLKDTMNALQSHGIL